MVVKSLLPIEDVDVAVTTATTLVGLSLPDDARSMYEEISAITFDLDDRFAWRLDLIGFFLIPLAKLDTISRSKSHFLLFLRFGFPFGGHAACNADTSYAHGNKSHESQAQPKCCLSMPAYSVTCVFWYYHFGLRKACNLQTWSFEFIMGGHKINMTFVNFKLRIIVTVHLWWSSSVTSKCWSRKQRKLIMFKEPSYLQLMFNPPVSNRVALQGRNSRKLNDCQHQMSLPLVGDYSLRDNCFMCHSKKVEFSCSSSCPQPSADLPSLRLNDFI